MKPEENFAWHTLQVSTVLARFGCNPSGGLSSQQAAARLQEEGPNELVEKGAKSPLHILAEQFASLMVLLLIGAAVVSGIVLGEWEDAAVILVIVALNALLGFLQELRAERALAALKSLATPKVRVLRDSRIQEVDSRQLVRGDIVLVEAGNLVPADCRILESANLRVQESALTGEAVAVEKNPEVLEENELPLGDRRNMLYMGTIVTYGRASAVVTATGMASELGTIATLLQEAKPERTVLQKKLASLSMVLVFSALALIAVVALEGWLLQGQNLKELFLTAVSMAVAAIPEGLPAVVTIALALGAQRMLRRRALIRKLPAVESLGSVTVICSDKTGTLTQNRMTVTVLDLHDRRIDLGRASKAAALSEQAADDSSIWLLLTAAALCNDAVLKSESPGPVVETQGNEEFETLGDPTEGALVEAAARAGLIKPALEKLLPRSGELPFDSERKRMSTAHRLVRPDSAPATADRQATAESVQLPRDFEHWLEEKGADTLYFSKGAADSLLEVCTSVWRPSGPEPLDESGRAVIARSNEELAAEGIRVLGVAFEAAGLEDGPQSASGQQSERSERSEQSEQWEKDLVFVGLIGMLDPLRTEVKEAVDTCRRAGIRPVMITGDHPLIARTIGRELGLDNSERFLTGRDLAGMETEELAGEVENTSIYARVAPEHKLKIVDALQERGHIVAMTGDGVNDAPALKSADIGVAMGITGTDVSKEAAAVVLQDDNFATIVSAVEEGRIIFDNILRFVRYILASNWAEIVVMLTAPLIGLPIPLFPVQILWMNLVTDGLPALALGVEPGEIDVMNRPPREPRRPILTIDSGVHILWVGLLAAALALGIGARQFSPALSSDPAAWRTMLFTTLVLSQLTLAMAERSRRSSLWQIGLFSNKYMIAALAITFVLQMGVIYLPFLQGFFETTPLTFAQLCLCLALSGVVLVAVETEKLIQRAARTKAKSRRR